MPTTIDIKDIIKPDTLATQIAFYYTTWEQQRLIWLNEQKAKKAFLSAVKTDTTQVGQSTPWKNNTTLPKLTQLRDNLHANYMAALFPNSSWLSYQSLEDSKDAKDKRRVTEFYMRHKLEQVRFRTTIAKLVLDWIDYGNCFAIPVYERKLITDDKNNIIPGFSGANLMRVSPLDIVFNPLAPSFLKTPKIIRSVKTLGDLANEIKNNPEMKYLEAAFTKAIEARKSVSSSVNQYKNVASIAAGFGGIDKYYESGFVEILDFYGDIYETSSNTLKDNRLISIIDRSFVIRDVANPSWLGETPIYHCGWRLQSDSLWAQGALDNLVGMQFQIDKLHNSKADILDQIIHPVTKQRGDVQAWVWKPGEKIIMGDDGDVEALRPDVNALQFANNDIATLLSLMEEMAGAPKNAMGIRTPGEKTKFEVQTLENASNRIFVHATSYFEEEFLERVLNAMLEINRRNMNQAESIRMESENFSTATFKSISKEDLAAKGSLKPIGARYFSEKANKLQEFLRLGEMLSTNPATRAHFSGKKFGEKALEMAGFDNIKELFRENVAVYEQVSTAAASQTAQEVTTEQKAIGVPNPELAEGVPNIQQSLTDGQ